MKKRNGKNFGLFMVGVLTLLLAFSTGCTAAAAKQEKSPLFQEVVTGTENAYTFAGTDWTMTKEEVMKKLNVDADSVEVDLEDRFTVKVHSDELDSDGWATYVFIDGKKPLCTGRYAFTLEGNASEIWEKVNKMALSCMPEPKQKWEENTSMTWEAKDGSTFELLFNDIENIPPDKVSVVLEVKRPNAPVKEFP